MFKLTYSSDLYGKKYLHYTIETLYDLEQLFREFPREQLYMVKDGCTSFHTWDYIENEYKEKTIKMEDNRVVTMIDYLKEKGAFTKLENSVVFNCEVLRGYPNKYNVEWQTKDSMIKATSEVNLWEKVTHRIETDKNKYAENTVRQVKLIPNHPCIFNEFPVLKWYGGSTTSYNDSECERDIKRFESFIKEGCDL